MRPYLVLAVVVLLAGAAFAQQPFPRPECFYGCAPFVPLLSTPMVSLQTVSPNPVGATNATAGLVAGATNSTLSETQGSESSVYTVPVWYQGGAPVTASEVNLFPEPLGRDGRVRRGPMHGPMQEEHPREGNGQRAEARGGWTYYTGHEHSASAVEAATNAKGMKKASHVYTNEDVEHENDKNGTVKYDGKTEKM